MIFSPLPGGCYSPPTPIVERLNITIFGSLLTFIGRVDTPGPQAELTPPRT